MSAAATGEAPAWAWIALAVGLTVLLGVDLVLHRQGKRRAPRSNLAWSTVWIGAGLAFDGFVLLVLGRRAAEEYLAAYIIEKSLSVDNLFVFLVIFGRLRIPEEHQRRVLTFGILGALVFRAALIFLGLAAVERWSWLRYLFGASLLFTAARIAVRGRELQGGSRLLAFLENRLPFTPQIEGDRFVVIRAGRRVATPLALALVAVELTDILFAIDSVPAALAVTQDPFVIYSSNAFAMLGLRSLYAWLASVLPRVEYLHYGLAGVLAFAGAKMLLSDLVHVPTLVSVATVTATVGASVLASVVHRRRQQRGLASTT